MLNPTLLQMFHWYSEGDGSYWRSVLKRAGETSSHGFTGVWLPPAYKGFGGVSDVGYGAYDLYDLGEFNQKGSVRTKYGTRDEYLAAVSALHREGIQVIADTVFNHRMGGDETEDVEALPFRQDDRLQPSSSQRTIRSWTRFTFPGRKGTHSPFTWNHTHFDAVDWDALEPGPGSIYLLEGKRFDSQDILESRKYGYLMGCELDCRSQEVQTELESWGHWYLDTTRIDGFRLDAIKHIAAEFFPRWLASMEQHAGRKLFVVGDYWQNDIGILQRYLDQMDGQLRIFDVPLHYNLHTASRAGNWYDMRRIFDGSLVQVRPAAAITFVDNHDSQPLQALDSCVEPWFKPIAYALILLRAEGTPCVFEADWNGASYDDKGRDGAVHHIEMPSHRYLLERFLWARQNCCFGTQRDWFDHWNCIGWTRGGDSEHPAAMAVIVSNGPNGSKWMDVQRQKTEFLDITGHNHNSVWTNEDGWGQFHTPGGSLSVWVEASAVPPQWRN